MLRIGANIQVATALAINGTATVYTNSFKIGFADNFGAMFLASSVSSTPNLKIELEQGDAPPTIEGSSDANYVVADGVGDVYASLTAITVKRRGISPVPSMYGRYKITGNTGNPTDTLINIKNFMQDGV